MASETSADFDADWYVSAYPAAALDVARGAARDLAEHYHTRGRQRGYLPHPKAERPVNAARPRSAFGGLWVDQANALDVLDGKRELGLVDDSLHTLISAFIRDGHVILPNALPQRVLAGAQAALERAYAGEDPGQWFWCEGVPGLTHYVPDCRERPAKALEIHARAEPVRDAILSPAITAFLHAIFERPALATQSLGFWRGSAQDVHQDSAYVGYSMSMHFVASWIALEDVTPGAGELCYYPGSHTFPDFTYADRFKATYDAHRAGVPAPDMVEQQNRHEASLPRLAQERGIDLKTFHAKAGDALIWAADLAHGGRPISAQATRKSIVTHYCPKEVAPTYFEHVPACTLTRHPSGGYYSTFSWD